MKIFLPKSHRIKHKVLKFLSKERMKNGGINNIDKYTFSLREIAKEINEKYVDIYEITDYLFYKKLVVSVKNENELINPKLWVTNEGIELYTSFELINDGKVLNLNLYSNMVSILFTIILGFITIFTVVYNKDKSKELDMKMNQLKSKNIHLEQELLNLSKKMLEIRNYVQQKVDYQTNIQTDDKK